MFRAVSSAPEHLFNQLYTNMYAIRIAYKERSAVTIAEGDAHVINNFKEQVLLKTIDCNSDTFMMALYSDAYAAGQLDGADPAYSTTNEIVASGYTAGGQSIGTPVVTQDDTNDRASWDDDGTDVTWTNLATATILRAILYDFTTATKWLCIIWEIATNSNGGNYTLAFNSLGMLLVS